jgi:hypothetical protein
VNNIVTRAGNRAASEILNETGIANNYDTGATVAASKRTAIHSVSRTATAGIRLPRIAVCI